MLLSSLVLHFILEQEMIESFPRRKRSDLCLGAIDTIPVDYSSSCIEVNIRKGQESRSLPDPAANEEENNHWSCQIRHEEIFCSPDLPLVSKWIQSSVELQYVRRMPDLKGNEAYLSDQHKDDQNQTKI